MKKLKSVFAIIGVILLVLLYVLTFFFAIYDDPKTYHFLGASLTATVIIPTFIWIIGIFARLSSPSDRPENDTKDDKNNRNQNAKNNSED